MSEENVRRFGAALLRDQPAAWVRGKWMCRTLNPDGTVCEQWEVRNAAVVEGLNDLLEAGFRSGTQRTTWYAGLINNSGFSGLSSADTAASHAGWAEYQGYADSTRRTWSPGAAANGTIVNATAMQFTNGGSSASIKGMFLISDSTKGGTTGKLWATAVEDTARSLAAGQVFQVYYELDLVPQS